MTDTTNWNGQELIPVLHKKLDNLTQELLQVSKEDLNSGIDYWKRFQDKMKRQEDLMKELIPIARKLKTLKGRTVRFPMADSYALYLVTKVNKKTVELTWLNYCDAWVDDRIGYKGNIDINYVQKQKDFDDYMSDMAEKKRKEVQTKQNA